MHLLDGGHLVRGNEGEHRRLLGVEGVKIARIDVLARV
jgi:hypothetical protein